ncbi:MAG: hypothetical protein J6N54_11150 [Bacteroidales bacterium]|nr:hypothetical protein [Bacteroidales bacterium]
MKRLLILAISLAAVPLPSFGAPMKARVIQQPFSLDRQGLDACFEWTMDELRKCDESLDIIVLPEFCEVPGNTTSREDFLETSRRNGPAILKLCAETAKRCNSLIFAGVVDTSLDVPRNAMYVFDRNGEIIGEYFKEHLTRGEWDKLDMRYTQEWTQPYILDIEGVRYAFMTCYDFYFYENYSNIARWKPDVIVGVSHQRSDTFRALDIINTFCAYNTGAYLVRASVSMGLASELGGCSCVVAPTGEILGTLRSEVASLDVTFDPKKKYLKPAGYGNPPALHSEYIEIGRRPWKYRPGGGAIVPPFDEAPAKRLCAIDGLSSLASESLLGALGEILRKLSCHAIMNIHLDGKEWSIESIRELLTNIFVYDALGHVYLTSSDKATLAALKETGTKIPLCLAGKEGKDIVDEAVSIGCAAIELPAGLIDAEIARKAGEKGLRVGAVAVTMDEAVKALDAGAQTVLTNEYLAVAKATALK